MKLEPDHTAKLGLLDRPHHSMANFLVGHLIWRRPHFGVGFKVGETVKVVLARKGHQRQAVVKNGGRGDDLACMVVPKQAKVSKVSVLVINQRVKYQHTPQLLSKLPAQSVVVVKAGLDAIALNQPPYFGQHTADSQLRGGSKRLMAPAHAGVGHQRQNFRKAVLIEVMRFKRSLKALRGDPIAIV